MEQSENIFKEFLLPRCYPGVALPLCYLVLLLFAACAPTSDLCAQAAVTNAKIEKKADAKTAKSPSSVCFGPEGSSRHILFLHGMMPANAGFHSYQSMLKQVAEDSRSKIFAPVSQDTCHGSNQCWKRDPASAAKTQLDNLTKNALECFGPGVRSFEVHGHSNGAYFLASLAELCELRLLRRVFFIGGGSQSTFRIKIDQNCPDLHFASGGKDRIYSPLSELAIKAKAMGFRAHFHSLAGGHDLGVSAYQELLQKTADATLPSVTP
jgi:predicted esterase